MKNLTSKPRAYAQRLFRCIVVSTLVLVISGCLSEPATNTTTAISGSPYLMAFHACDTATANCSSPQEHQVYLAESADGAVWNIVKNWKPFTGSVPDIIRRDDIVYIYSAKQGGSLITYNLATQTISEGLNVTVTGVNGFVDPAPYIDAAGNLSLFFLYCRSGSVSVMCFTPQNADAAPVDDSKEFVIGSATEVSGSNGAQFTLTEGDRAIDDGGTDPDVYFDGTQYILYISHGPSFTVWTAPELHGTYTKITTLSNGFMSTNGTGGVPSGLFDTATNTYWSYAHVTDPSTRVSVIRRALHQDFSKSLTETAWETVMTGETVGLSAATSVESPGVIVN